MVLYNVPSDFRAGLAAIPFLGVLGLLPLPLPLPLPLRLPELLPLATGGSVLAGVLAEEVIEE